MAACQEGYNTSTETPLLHFLKPVFSSHMPTLDHEMQVATGRAPTARRSVEEILISVLSSPEDDPTSIAGELSHTPEVGSDQA